MDNLSKDEIEQLIINNSGLIFKSMKELNLIGDADAESAGYEALYNAILNYDPEKSKAKFSSYAYVSIYNRVNGVHRSRSTLINKNTELLWCSDDDEYGSIYAESIFRSTYDLESNILIKEQVEDITNYLEEYIDDLKQGLPKTILSNWYYLYNCDVPLTVLCEDCNCSHAYCRKVLKTFREDLRRYSDARY